MKRYLLITISLFFLAVSLKAQEINQKWLEEINQGKKLYKAGGFDAALKRFQVAASIVPFDTTAFVYISDCGLKSGQANVVKPAVEKLKLLKYSKPFLYEVQAATLRSIEKDYQGAYNIIQEGLKVFPGNSTLLYEELLTLYETGNYANTFTKAEEFINRFPKHLDAAKLLLNIVTLKLPDKDKAAKFFASIRKNFPSDVDLLRQEVDFYLRSGNLDMAQSQIEQMIAISPNDAKLHYNLGLIFYYRNNYEKSIEECHKAIQIDPNFVDAHFNIGIFFFLMGVEYNKTLIEMNPFQFASQGKEAISAALNFFETAKPHLQKVTISKPEELDAFEALTTIDVLEKNLKSLLPQIEAADKPAVTQTVETPKGTPMLFINKLRFEYPNKMFGSLRKGDKGWIRFELHNAGNGDAVNLTALITEPISLPGIKYESMIKIDSLAAGKSKLIEIPISYEENNPNIRGIKKIADVPNKLRVLIKEPNGNNSDIVEVQFKLDSDPGALSAFEEDYWETSTIDFSPEPIPANYLLIVGVDKYSFWPKLNNAVKDAKDIRSILTSRYQFSEKNIFELYDENATYENLRNELVKIKNEITPYDNLIIYYAGHGFYDEEWDNGYWVPVNAHESATNEFIQTSVIYNYLTKITAKHIFLIADACFSGSLFNTNAISYKENDDKIPSRWAFSSGNIEVVADGIVGTNSPFAQSLINVLSTARKNLSVSQLIQNVKFKVESITEQTPIGRPMKMEEHKGGEFIFYIKKNL
ncbi:MAG: caspase family protein [Tenuifilaceae bacterium]